MSTNKSFATGTGLITVGGTLLGMVPLKEEIREHLVDLPGTFFNTGLAIGVLCCTAGLLLILASLVSRATIDPTGLTEYLAGVLGSTRFSRFERAPATEGDFDPLFEFSREEFGEEIDDSVRGKMLRWYHKNSEYLWVLRGIRVRNGQRLPHLVGYFSLFPLTKTATRLVDRGELYGGQIRPEDMVSLDATPSGVYIGGIAARGQTAKAFAYGVLAERLDKYLRKGVPLYTRPVSDDGRRLVKKWGFSPVGKLGTGDPSKVVWKLRQPDAVLIKPKIQRSRARRASAAA